MNLKGQKSNEHNPMEHLLAVPKIEFQKCFQQWQKWWNKCVYEYAEGVYCENKYLLIPVNTVSLFP
jgi:hypothetical protein